MMLAKYPNLRILDSEKLVVDEPNDRNVHGGFRGSLGGFLPATNNGAGESLPMSSATAAAAAATANNGY